MFFTTKTDSGVLTWALAARVAFIFLTISLLGQDRLSPAEERGRQIFETGTSASGNAIETSIAGNGRLAGSILPCVNCHGHDGKGKPESGVVPSNLTWDALTKPYGVTHPDGRAHPPYTEPLLQRAITMGIDPAGNALGNAMPRFQLSIEDATDLVAYIKKLGRPVEPGLTSTRIRLGVILPPPSQASTSSQLNANQVMRRAVSDYFDRVNGAGGIFSRRIELTFLELPLDPAQRSKAVLDFLLKEQIFAVVAGDLTGSESEIAEIMVETGTPTIATVAPFPQTDAPFNKFVFYLDGGLEKEMEALLALVKEKFAGNGLRTAIVFSEDEPSRKAAEWLQAHLTESKVRQLVVSEDVQAANSADVAFWLRTDLGTRSVAAGGSRETVFLIPGSLAEPVPSMSSSAQIFIALGAASLAENPQDPNAVHHMTWNRTVASAEIAIEAMTRAGRNLTRDSLIQGLEGFYNVQTSLPQSISFGPTRRVGAGSVRIVKFDPHSRKFIPAQGGVRAKGWNLDTHYSSLVVRR